MKSICTLRLAHVILDLIGICSPAADPSPRLSYSKFERLPEDKIIGAASLTESISIIYLLSNTVHTTRAYIPSKTRDHIY